MSRTRKSGARTKKLAQRVTCTGAGHEHDIGDHPERGENEAADEDKDDLAAELGKA